MNRHTAWHGLLALSIALPHALRAQEPTDTLRLAEAIAEARGANPGLVAARLQADAAALRPSQAGALPDPQLTLGLENRPLSGFGTEEMMTMNTLGITQMLPWPGKRGFGSDRYQALADAARLDAAETERQLAARVSGLYADLAATDRMLAILRRTRGLLDRSVAVARTRYAVGDAPQQDVLQAQVTVARMDEDLLVMEEERVARAARLNALLGRRATGHIAALELSAPGGPLPSADSLLALAVERRPALRAARERVRAADAAYRKARRELYPDLMLSVEYGQRPRYDDMLSVMVGVSVPLWGGRRQLPMRREMEAMRAAEDAMARDLANETYAMLTGLRAEAERARRLTALYQREILPQARAAVEAAVAAYRVGTADFMTLVDSEMTVNRYETELVRLAAVWQRATAAIEALAGSEGDDR
jgi:outer membrane protein, heavy metal efflux system